MRGIRGIRGIPVKEVTVLRGMALLPVLAVRGRVVPLLVTQVAQVAQVQLLRCFVLISPEEQVVMAVTLVTLVLRVIMDVGKQVVIKEGQE